MAPPEKKEFKADLQDREGLRTMRRSGLDQGSIGTRSMSAPTHSLRFGVAPKLLWQRCPASRKLLRGIERR